MPSDDIHNDDDIDATIDPKADETIEEKVRRLERELRNQRELGPQERGGVDPYQIVVTGFVKPTRFNTDTINFVLNLALFKLIFIVNIPDEGENEAKIYIKFRLNSRQNPR